MIYRVAHGHEVAPPSQGGRGGFTCLSNWP